MADRFVSTVHLDPVIPDEVLAALTAAAEGDDLADLLPPGEVPFTATLMLLDTWTDDFRWFAAAGFSHRDLPMEFMAVDHISEGPHIDAQVVGRIESITVTGLRVEAAGFYADEPFARTMAAHAALGNLTGVSIDATWAKRQIEFPPIPEDEIDPDPSEPLVIEEDAETMPKLRYLEYELTGATQTPAPAFADAQIAVALPDAEPLAASSVAMALDLDVGPAMAKIDALAAEMERQGVDPDAIVLPTLVVTTSPPGPFSVVTAAGGPLRPPRPWFDQPALTGPTPATWTPDGQGFGHFGLKPEVALALGIDPCHTGSPDRCVCLPSTATGYSRFMAPGQVVECDDGSLVNVGAVTLRGGHPLKGTARTEEDAQRHYDDTDSAVAYVTVGDDEWGAWFAGCIRPGITDEQVYVLRAAGLSGHWQPYPRTGTNELIRICCVNTMGFPIGVAASGFDLPDAVPTVTVEVGEDGEERVVELFAAGHPEVLAAMKADAMRAAQPATAGDLAALAERVQALTSDVAAAKAALSTLDPEVRERVLAKLG